MNYDLIHEISIRMCCPGKDCSAPTEYMCAKDTITTEDFMKALCEARLDISAVLDDTAVIISKEPDEVLIYKAREAFRKARRGGISGMTIDAQFRSEFAPELAFYATIVKGL
jgi:hypothetical protein